MKIGHDAARRDEFVAFDPDGLVKLHLKDRQEMAELFERPGADDRGRDPGFASQKAAQILLYNIDVTQRENPLREMSETFLQTFIVGIVQSNMQISLDFHEKAELVRHY